MLKVKYTCFLNRKFNYIYVFKATCLWHKRKITHFLIQNKLRECSPIEGDDLQNCKINSRKAHLSFAEPLKLQYVDIIGAKFSSF